MSINRKVISTKLAPAAIGAYSQAIIANNFLYISGQLGMDPKTGQIVEGGAETEVKQALDNINAILKEAGCSFENVVKMSLLLHDMNDFAAVNEIYATYFEKDPPARVAFAVAALPKNAKIEIETIAVVQDTAAQ